MNKLDLQLISILLLADKAADVPEDVRELLGHPADRVVTKETLARLVAFIFEQAARTARIAVGQDWSDDTTPAEMARFIAESIEAHKPTVMD